MRSGFGVGFVVGMSGVGGGSLMTPLLILLFGIHPTTAVGSDLLYAAATKTGGTLVHGLSRTIDWRVVGRLSTGSVPTTALTLLALAQLDLRGAVAGGLITCTLSGALFVTGIALIFRRKILAAYAARIGRLGSRHTALLTIVTGAALGVLVSISSVGAGADRKKSLVIPYPPPAPRPGRGLSYPPFVAPH